MTSMDPYQTYKFRVEVSGISDSSFHFTKCSSFSVTVGNQENRGAGSSQITRQIHRQTNYEPVTLSYGMTNSRDLWNWLLRAAEGKAERKNVTITFPSSDGSTSQAKYELINAWPQKWQGQELDASSNELAIAQLVLVYEQLNRLSGIG